MVVSSSGRDIEGDVSTYLRVSQILRGWFKGYKICLNTKFCMIKWISTQSRGWQLNELTDPMGMSGLIERRLRRTIRFEDRLVVFY